MCFFSDITWLEVCDCLWGDMRLSDDAINSTGRITAIISSYHRFAALRACIIFGWSRRTNNMRCSNDTIDRATIVATHFRISTL